MAKKGRVPKANVIVVETEVLVMKAQSVASSETEVRVEIARRPVAKTAVQATISPKVADIEARAKTSRNRKAVREGIAVQAMINPRKIEAGVIEVQVMRNRNPEVAEIAATAAGETGRTRKTTGSQVEVTANGADREIDANAVAAAVAKINRVVAIAINAQQVAIAKTRRRRKSAIAINQSLANQR